MATLEDEIKDLKEKNNELAQKVQYWKMTAAERENEKLNLMKELNELRLKLSRLRNTGGYKAKKLDTSIQQAGEKAISYLVEASSEIARSIEIAKAYMRDRQELEAQSPRWSTLGGTPTAERTDKVHRVPPMMMGGQSIQPVVALSRTMLNTSSTSTTTRSPNQIQNRSLTERAVPMHMLQDVYIPLTRIDISDIHNNNMETDTEVEANNADDSAEELGLDDGEEAMDDSARMSEDDNEFSGRKLHALSEEEESETEDGNTPRVTVRIDNPLEGPSWLLDSPQERSSNQSGRATLEPDSTTEPDRTPATSTSQKSEDNVQKENNKGVSVRVSCEFSPTVRRRKRTSSPPTLSTPHHYSPRPASLRKNSTSGRVLKVMVAKMRLDSDGEGSPPKRARSPPDPLLAFDAPSPNGATDSAVIVSVTRSRLLDKEIKPEPDATLSRQDSHEALRCRINSQDSLDSHESRISQDTYEPRNRTKEPENQRRTNNQNGNVRGRLLSEDSVQRSRGGSHDSRDSDSGSGGGGDSICEGRTRRPRKNVTYKEKPLNRKLRR
ncbi:unnamed protein product [Arctia plantaginis]|uniref:Shugoshin C-terminal domain-containing protein n=1 Tax=Arctia plantaginis TaxID=874455 RepID=A0A8S0ZEJ8_ARCPL|nr:unnamed protein product [Arctia plantaginis]